MTFDGDEIERIQDVKLRRMGISPQDADEMDMFDLYDLLEIGAVEDYMEHEQLAKLIAHEVGKTIAKMFRRR